MRSLSSFARAFVHACFLGGAVTLCAPALSQNLPGSSLSAAGIPADTKTLFQLAEQAYPSLFGTPSGWRSHGGYTYQFYAAGGVYAGVRDGNVFLLGGPFGSSIVQKGILGNAIAVLQSTIANQQGGNNGGSSGGNTGGTAADFAGLTGFSTVAALAATFKSITMEYGSSIGALVTTAAIKLEHQETGTIDGKAADKLIVTIYGGNIQSSSGIAYTMWVDHDSNILRLTFPGGFEYPPATAQLVGQGLVSGFLLALTATDAPYIAAGLSGELQNPAFSQKVSSRNVGAVSAQVATLTLTASGANVVVDIADFGNFSMATRLESTLSTMTTFFEVVELELR